MTFADRPRLASAAALLGAAVLAAPAAAQEADLQSKRDGAWVAVSGEVVTAAANEFTLDHGQGSITVEMDDFDPDPDAAPLRPGDKVTVYGFVDDGFFEERTIEASSVWNERSNSFHYASAMDEEAVEVVFIAYPAITWAGPGVTIGGQVTDIDGREFEMMTGEATTVTVDTSDMPYDPLDAEGAQIVTVGAHVSVTGELDDRLFTEAEMTADSLMILHRRPAAD
ncbi:MAG: hypothetical protein R6V44_03845 [Paracoccaceae bacterium]